MRKWLKIMIFVNKVDWFRFKNKAMLSRSEHFLRYVSISLIGVWANSYTTFWIPGFGRVCFSPPYAPEQCKLNVYWPYMKDKKKIGCSHTQYGAERNNNTTDQQQLLMLVI